MSHRLRKQGLWLGLLAVGLLSLSAVADVSLELKFREMDPHVGQAFFLRVVDVDRGAEISRLAVPEILSGSFELAVSGLLEGVSYHIDFFSDHNGNGLYDAPPVDHAWRIDLPNVQADGMLTFVHSTMFTDIGWPPSSDGVIEEGEYAHELLDDETGMTVYWFNDDTLLYIGLVSPGTGWLSIGFEPERMMLGANIIIAGISDGELTIEDHIGTSPTAHALDDVDNIIQAAGSEGEGRSVLEFVIPLDSGDEDDKALTPGSEVTIILAYHRSNDSLRSRHSERSTASIVLD